ncbi:uracil-DNA glycosylase, partial [bacterium]|nr:uracil-DNA glycosylase [bacterium]
EDMYIADIVKCRPPYSRQPEKEEINSCIPFLKKQIQAVRPRVIVCLGSIAAQTLLLNDLPIEKLRGRFFDFNGIPVMPTYHPVDLIKNPKDKWRTWDDMQKVLGRIT